MPFYKKIRQVISHYVEPQVHEVFDSAVELDESYFGGAGKVASHTRPDAAYHEEDNTWQRFLYGLLP